MQRIEASCLELQRGDVIASYGRIADGVKMFVIANIISYLSFRELLIAAISFFLGAAFGIAAIKAFLQ
jgi:hypothetical protein